MNDINSPQCPYTHEDPTALSEYGKVYKRCVDQWGVEAQVNMVTEELGELIVAIQKWKRNPSERTIHDIASEVADVELMLGQLHYMMETTIERKYIVHLDMERVYKLSRLIQRLNKSEGKLHDLTIGNSGGNR